MLLLPLNILLFLFKIIITVKIWYNVSLIEYSFIDIALIKMHQHICDSYVNIARVIHPSTLQLSGRRYVTDKAYLVTITTHCAINTFKHFTIDNPHHSNVNLVKLDAIIKFQHSLK